MRASHDDGSNPGLVNPLANAVPWRLQLYNRIKLFPWWIHYHRGATPQAVLRDRILELGSTIGLQEMWLKRIIRHAVSEFSKKGLGADYYGYHNIDHELEAAYFTMLAAKNQNSANKFSDRDILYLFVAALFHDYDPLKAFDKPNEDSIERFIRGDARIRRFIDEVGLSVNLVIAIIHRTAYPFRGEIAENATRRMEELFTDAGIPKDDAATRKHYAELGWFLSVAERVAGYALGDFEHSKDLARRNAHALGWHPSVINERSAKYFDLLKDEKEMFDRVMEGMPKEYREVFNGNVETFRDTLMMEQELRSLVKDKLRMMSVVEKCGAELDSYVQESILDILRDQPMLVPLDEKNLGKSLKTEGSILITLRINDEVGDIVGFAKGESLEKCRLRRGTKDHNNGKGNTAYLEGIGIKHGFWGETGGHLLRMRFLEEAIKRGYKFVTGYAHRDVIIQRMTRGENIQIVQKYDPDKLDYYRADLSISSYRIKSAEDPSATKVRS
ncbi:MAG TPA: hypothetical protein VD736_02090 [Nitrososphaera sp.]|nr:hypothetical protein [Nitrososphaera sp.]